MSDAYLRELERRLAGGDVSDYARYISELLRVGYIDETALRVASFLRDEASRTLISTPQPRIFPGEIHHIAAVYRTPLRRSIIALLHFLGNLGIGQGLATPTPWVLQQLDLGVLKAYRVKSKNETDLVDGSEVVMRALFAAIGAALDVLASAYIDPEEDYDPYHQINFRLYDNYQRLVELFIRDTEYEVIQSILPKMSRIHNEIITNQPVPIEEHELIYRVLINGLERLGRTLSILVAPEFEDHNTAFYEAACETLESAVSVANLVIRGNNWPVIRDAICNDVVGWLFYRDPLRELVE